MKKVSALAVLALFSLTLSAAAAGNQYFNRQIAPIVSTDWLSEHQSDANLLIIDGRTAEEYAAGHIANSSSVPVDRWWVTKGSLLLELPDPDDLRDLIGTCGITKNTKVVLVNKIDTDFDRAQVTRVAFTLAYGGVRNVAILNGGINKWIAEARPTTTEPFEPPVVNYTGVFNERIAVSKSYVSYYLNLPYQARIVDARVTEDFFGVAPLSFSTKAGHIPRALCLPTPWVFTADGCFRDVDDLEAMAKGVMGPDTYKRTILYCGVGGYASTWWFILSEVLGYYKVRVYEGSMQEWTEDPEAPVVKYSW